MKRRRRAENNVPEDAALRRMDPSSSDEGAAEKRGSIRVEVFDDAVKQFIGQRFHNGVPNEG